MHGLSSSSSAKISVNASFAGFSPASATLVGNSLARAYIPFFGNTKMTSKGFTVQINNFNSKFDHKLESSVGRVSVNSSGVVSVIGLGAGVTANVNLKIYEGDQMIYETTVTGQALAKKMVKK